MKAATDICVVFSKKRNILMAYGVLLPKLPISFSD